MEPSPTSDDLARQAYHREPAISELGTEAARVLEQLASHRQPIAPNQVLAVAMMLRRGMHEA